MSERITTLAVPDGCTSCNGRGKQWRDDPKIDVDEWEGDLDDIPQEYADCEACKGVGSILGNGMLHVIRAEYV